MFKIDVSVPKDESLVQVNTTHNRGLTPDELSAQCVEKIGTIEKNQIFQTLIPFFLLFGGVVTKNAFSKMFLTFRYAFLTQKRILFKKYLGNQ